MAVILPIKTTQADAFVRLGFLMNNFVVLAAATAAAAPRLALNEPVSSVVFPAVRASPGAADRQLELALETGHGGGRQAERRRLMSVFVMNAGASAEAADVVEAQLRPAIPRLKRIDALDAIGKPSFNSASRPFVILALGHDKPELSGLVDDLISRNTNVFFLVVSDDISAKDYKRLIQLGNAGLGGRDRTPARSPRRPSSRGRRRPRRLFRGRLWSLSSLARAAWAIRRW